MTGGLDEAWPPPAFAGERGVGAGMAKGGWMTRGGVGVAILGHMS